MGLKFREDLYLRGFNFAIFFSHNREKREIKDRQTRTLKGNEKKFELSAIRLFFFLGIAGNCTAIFIADTSSLSTDPTDLLALRARCRASRSLSRASRCFRKERTEKQDSVCAQGTSQRYVSCLK